MDLIRKIVRIGSSKGVIIPKTWFEGKNFKKVKMHLNDKITIEPFDEEE